MPSKKVIKPRSLEQREINPVTQSPPEPIFNATEHAVNPQGTEQPTPCGACEQGTIHYAAE